MDVVIGADIGQRQDPTAIAVAELQWRDDRQREGLDDHWVIRHLARLPLGTTYPAIVAELVRIVDAVKARVEEVREPISAGYKGLPGGVKTFVPATYEIKRVVPTVALFVDGTGVGQPVVDLLEAAGANPIGCYFVYGERRTQQGREVRLGKAWMVSRLQALAQTGRLHLPQTDEAEATRKELLDYEIRVSEDGHDIYGAFKTGRHDDLVTAIGLAVQKPRRGWGSV